MLRAVPTLAVLRARRDEILAVAQRYGAYNLRVFGSVARQDAEPAHDVDFLADFYPHSLLDRITLIHELSDLLECRVDVVQEKMLHPEVRNNALKDAVPL